MIELYYLWLIIGIVLLILESALRAYSFLFHLQSVLLAQDYQHILGIRLKSSVQLLSGSF